MCLAGLDYDLQVGRQGGIEATSKSLEFHPIFY